MTRPDQPPPGEDIAKGSDGQKVRDAAGGQPGDPDPRDPTEDASNPPETPEPQEPPD